MCPFIHSYPQVGAQGCGGARPPPDLYTAQSALYTACWGRRTTDLGTIEGEWWTYPQALWTTMGTTSYPQLLVHIGSDSLCILADGSASCEQGERRRRGVCAQCRAPDEISSTVKPHKVHNRPWTCDDARGPRRHTGLTAGEPGPSLRPCVLASWDRDVPGPDQTSAARGDLGTGRRCGAALDGAGSRWTARRSPHDEEGAAEAPRQHGRATDGGARGTRLQAGPGQEPRARGQASPLPAWSPHEHGTKVSPGAAA